MTPTQGLPAAERRWAVLVIMFGLTLAVLDGSIANIALPSIARSLKASPADAIRIVNLYLLTITVSLLPLASLGDRIGYQRVYLCGLALFTAASVAYARSDSLTMLATMRVIQGFGAAAIVSVNAALVRAIYPPDKLGRGMSINASVIATASVLGPSVASGVLSIASWPWLFAVNLPIGLAALALGLKFLPRLHGHRQAYDYTSAGMNALVFGLAVTAVDGLGHGASLSWSAAMLSTAIVTGYFFVKRQQTQIAPLLPVDLFKIPLFALSIATSFCAFTAQTLTFVSLPFLLQNTFGMTQVQTGFLMTPWPLVIVFIAPVAGILADRYPAGMLGGIGLALMCAGLLLLATMGEHPAPFSIVWRMALCGVGFGTFQSPNSRQILASAPRHRSGGAGGMLGTARLSGQTLGAALVGLVFSLTPLGGSRLTLFLAAGFAATAAALSLRRLKAVKEIVKA